MSLDKIDVITYLPERMFFETLKERRSVGYFSTMMIFYKGDPKGSNVYRLPSPTLPVVAVCLLLRIQTTTGAFHPHSSSSTTPSAFAGTSIRKWGGSRLFQSDDWSSFRSFDDDDDDNLGLPKVDRQAYAVEDDDPEVKAAVGNDRTAPEIERDADPIQVVPGSYWSIGLDLLNDNQPIMATLSSGEPFA